MALEIEKKYLVINDLLPQLDEGEVYIQGYLCLNPLIRFRVKGNKVVITIKKVGSNGLSRDEFEFENMLDSSEIDTLVGLSVKKPIKKIRHKIKVGELTWEVDVYQDENKGLITADVEIPSEDYNFNLPPWINSEKEITNDPKYFNVNLGDSPFQSWSDK